MVKPRRRSSNNRRISPHCYYSEESPQFFKIFSPPGCSRRIKIPSTFVKNYLNGVSPSTSVVRVINYPCKRLWCIGINKIDNSFFFENGWPQFVRDNSLEKGDFIIFSYAEKSVYDVVIFGLNGCPKIFPIANTTDNEDEVQELPCNQDTLEPRQFKEMVENHGGVCKSGSKMPSFEIVLKPSYIIRNLIVLPLDFSNSCISTNTRIDARLKHSNKIWPVKLFCRGSGSKNYVFSKGWRSFVRDNTLKEGDVCTFQLIEGRNYEFNVAITRGSGTPNKAQATKATCLSNQSREEGNSNETRSQREEEDRNGRVEANIKDVSSNFISKLPFFQVTMTPSYLSRRILIVPTRFQNSYMNIHGATVNLQYSNNWWEVNCEIYGGTRLQFCSGWDKFANENNLKEGDVCGFELINKESYMFKVSIARAVGNTKNVSSIFITNHPFFQITMTRTYVSKQFLIVPTSFRNGYMKIDKATVKLQHSSKWWEVNCKSYGGKRLQFCVGWNKFVKENNLKEGDVCCFELMNIENFVFKVSIARADNNVIQV